MWPRWLVPRFGISTLLLAVAAVAVGLWFFYTLPVYLPDRQDRLARAAIDPYELSAAGNGDPAQAPPELVAIFGDSRLKHWAGVGSVYFLGKETLVSHGGDEMARVWDVKVGKQRRAIAGEVMALSGDGARLFLVSSKHSGSVDVWNTNTWTLELTLKVAGSTRCLGLAANRDGTRIAAAVGDPWKKNQLQVWDVPARRMLTQFHREEDSNHAFAIDNQGNRLALAEGEFYKVVDVQSGKAIGRAGPFRERGSKVMVWQVLFDTQSERVITGDALGQVVVWDYRTGTVAQTLPKSNASIKRLLLRGDPPWLTVCASSDAWDFHRVNEEWRLWGDIAPDAARRGSISGVAQTGSMLAFACGDQPIILSGSASPASLSGGKIDDVTCLAFDPLDRFVATSGRSGEISLWEMRTWRKVRTWPAENNRLRQLEFTPDGSSLVALGNVDAVVWDPDSGAERTRITMGAAPMQMAISPDSQFLAAPTYVRGGASPYAIRLWKISDGSVHQTIAHKSAANRGQLAFAGSNDTLVMGGGKGMTVWDLANSKLTSDLGNKTLHDVPLAVHPDGKRVAMQPWYGPIDIWDIAAQKNVLSVRVHGGKALVNSIAIHPAGKWAASAADDGAVCLWEVDTGAVVKSWQLGPPKGIIFQVAFSPDGRYLATVNGNGTAYMLRLDGIAGFANR